MEQLVLLIGYAVINGITIPGKFSNDEYDVVELFQLHLNTLDEMYRRLVKARANLEIGSLLENTKNSKLTVINEQVALIEAIVKVRLDIEAKAKTAEKERAEKAKTLSLLTQAKDAKEIDRIKNLSIDELNAEIAKVSS